jgi:hypothetical protein
MERTDTATRFPMCGCEESRDDFKARLVVFFLLLNTRPPYWNSSKPETTTV